MGPEGREGIEERWNRGSLGNEKWRGGKALFEDIVAGGTGVVGETVDGRMQVASVEREEGLW